MTELHQASAAPTGRTTLILMAAVAAVGSNALALSPILGDVAADLGATPAAVARAAAAYGAATALSALLLSPRVDRFGPARALRRAMAVLALAMLGAMLAPHWIALAGAQALAGLAAGVALPAAYALATALAPPGEGARLLGRVLFGWSVSLVAAIPLLAALAQAAGWRACFLLLAAIAAAVGLGARALPAAGRAEAAAAPGGPLAPLRIPTVPTLLGVCLLFMTAFYGVYAFFGEHVRAAHGGGAGAAGLAVLAYGIGFGVAGLGDGLVDRLGPRRVLPAALLAVAAVYAAMPAVAAYPGLVALAAAWGFGNHFGLNILVLLLSSARPAARGAVLGLNAAVTYLGALLGAAGLGEVYARAGFAAVAAAAALLLALAAGLAALPSARGRPAAEAAAPRRA
ncbi:MAG TPA: MFS transporter [Alphaproteobacteria bacterium]|nr:MFS transporter [Alphaproteobacteria bacterium]